MTLARQKEWGLVTANILYTVLVFWWLASTFAAGRALTAQIVALVIASLIWVALTALALGLTKQFITTAILILAIPAIILALGQLSLGAGIAAPILALLLLFTRWQLSGALRNRIKYRTVQIFTTAVKFLLIGLFISLAGLTMPLMIDNLVADNIQIPVESTSFILEPLSGITANIDSVLITDLINQQINTITGQSPTMTAIVVIVVLLITLRLLIPVFTWPILGLIAGLVIIARQTGLVYIAKSNQPVETLQL